MSEEIQVECSLCGRTGEPPASCDMCHGTAATQERGYTLSETRQGLGKNENRQTGLEPKPSSLVIGGAVNHPSHPEK